MRPPQVIEPSVFTDYLNRLVATGGDEKAAGLTLEDIGDMIFTRMKHVNPRTFTEAKEAKEPKAPKKVKGAQALDDLLG